MTPAGGSPAGRGRKARPAGPGSGRSRHRGPFVLNVRTLRSRPGNRQEVHLRGPIAELAITDAWVPEDADVRLDGYVESTLGGVTISGTVTAPWSATCRRCLDPASGVLVSEVRELCRDPPAGGGRRSHGGSAERARADEDAPVDGEDDGEYYRVGPDELDVEPIVHDACILELPLAPLCSESCRGLCPSCGANLNEGDCSCTGQGEPSGAAAGEANDSEQRQ